MAIICFQLLICTITLATSKLYHKHDTNSFHLHTGWSSSCVLQPYCRKSSCVSLKHISLFRHRWDYLSNLYHPLTRTTPLTVDCCTSGCRFGQHLCYPSVTSSHLHGYFISYCRLPRTRTDLESLLSLEIVSTLSPSHRYFTPAWNEFPCPSHTLQRQKFALSSLLLIPLKAYRSYPHPRRPRLQGVTSCQELFRHASAPRMENFRTLAFLRPRSPYP